MDWRPIVRAQIVAAREDTDQHAAATQLWAALYGSAPVAAKPPQPGVPLAVHRVIVRGLAADPAKRWPNADVMIHELDVAMRPRTTKWFVLFAVIVTACVVGGAWLAHHLKG